MEKAGYWKQGDIESQTGWKNHCIILRYRASIPLLEQHLFHCVAHFGVLKCYWSRGENVVTEFVVHSVLRTDAKTVHVCCALMATLVATLNHVNASKSPGKWMLFSSEHGTIVTGKAWGFSVLLVFFLYFWLIMVLCISSSSSSSLPLFPFPSLPPSILPSGCSSPLSGWVSSSSCCLTEGCDVGAATRGHYNTAASRPDGDVIWSRGTWTRTKGEKDKQVTWKKNTWGMRKKMGGEERQPV